MLDENDLKTYKYPYQVGNPTAIIKLASIIDASPFESDMPKEYCFKISTASRQYIISATSDVDMSNWLNLINLSRRSPVTSRFANINVIHERKALSEVSLISSFSKMKEIINIREQELLEALEDAYKTNITDAEEENARLSSILKLEMENYQNIQNVLKSQCSIITKIRSIQQVQRQSLNFKKFDFIEETEIKPSLQDENLKRLIVTNIHVSLENPQEVRIRRTNITRALK